MEQTILEQPVQSVETPTLPGSIGVIYQQPMPQLVPVVPVAQPVDQKRGEQPRRQEYPMANHSPTPPEIALLKALAIFKYFTAEKLAEYLQYSPGTLRDVKRRLQDMETRKLVEVANKQARANETPFVYTYGQAGHAILTDLGVRVEDRYRPAHERIHKAYPLSHTLAVNEVLLKAMLLEEQLDYAVTLSDYRDEPELKAHPLIVAIPDETEPTKLRPDLWLDFQAAHRRCLCVEVNLSKVWQRDWRHMIRTYLNCLPAYEKRFGTQNITIACIIATETDFPQTRLTDSERARVTRELNTRFTNLLKWTQAELTAHQLESEADAFIFTKAPLVELTPEQFYFSAHWVIPFDLTPRPLLSLRREAGDV